MPIEDLRKARSHLKAFRAVALSPEPVALDGGQPELEQALLSLRSALQRIQNSGPGAREELTSEAAALRAELQRTTRLLEEANRFYEGWLRWKATLAGGYSAQGQPAPAEEPRRALAEA